MPQAGVRNAEPFLGKIIIPSITTWNRLEGRPRRTDFTRSLRVEVRDPLWMICRQWQFGEFKAEDAGSAVAVKVQITTTKVNRYAADGTNARPYDELIPLETVVEREDIPSDLTTRITAGRQWAKFLDEEGLLHRRPLYLADFGFVKPTDPKELAHLESDPEASQMWASVEDRLVDGMKLLAAIRAGDHDTWVDANAAADAPELKLAAQKFVEWFERLFSAPRNGEPTPWRPSYLEYGFACSAPADEAGDGQVVLRADQYHRGHLDWYSFDVEAGQLADVGAAPGGVLKTVEPLSFAPAQIEFPGMPNVRWWEFEDRRTDFGALNAGTTDVAMLMLAEFGLIYGNDWMVVPYDLEVGTLCEVKGIVVTDVFGVKTFVRAAGSGADDDWQRWTMYNLSRPGEGGAADTRLYLPPAIGKMQESQPIERVLLMRDEMANMVWAIEDEIPGVVGTGTSGFESATRLARHLKPAGPATTPITTDAAIRFRLGTTVPENWIPMIAVHEPGSNREVRLQRAAMPRLVGTSIGPVVEPRGAMMREGLPSDPYFVHEEEVPRSGARLTRSYQRTRWFDGRVFTWIGRRKQTGRGKGSSGLEFDRIVPNQS